MQIRNVITYFLVFAFISAPAAAWAASVPLRWQANSEPDIAGYNLYYGKASRKYGSPRPLGKVTTETVDGLDEGQSYYFAITAVDTSGNESGFSSEVSAQATSSEPSTQPFGIVVSTRSDRSNPLPLNNRAISGTAYIFILPDSYISNVVFSAEGSIRNTDNYAPYTFDMPSDTRTIPNGTYTISARITDQSGSVHNVSATFPVSNAGSGGSGSGSNSAPPQAITLSANRPSPVYEGQTVALQAAVEGGDSNTEYRFSYRAKKRTIFGNKWTQWQTLRDWSSSSSYNWNTMDAAGACQLQINARNPADQKKRTVTDTMSMTVQKNQPDSVTLSTNITSPQEQGTNIGVSASATGGTGSYEYKFMYRKITSFSKGKWIVFRDWSGSSVVSWNTIGLKGKYELWVGARNSVSQEDASTSQKVTFKITK